MELHDQATPAEIVAVIVRSLLISFNRQFCMVSISISSYAHIPDEEYRARGRPPIAIRARSRARSRVAQPAPRPRCEAPVGRGAADVQYPSQWMGKKIEFVLSEALIDASKRTQPTACQQRHQAQETHPRRWFAHATTTASSRGAGADVQISAALELSSFGDRVGSAQGAAVVHSYLA